jgi:hypothetical protein
MQTPSPRGNHGFHRNNDFKQRFNPGASRAAGARMQRWLVVSALVLVSVQLGCRPEEEDPAPPPASCDKGTEGCACLEGAIRCRGDSLVCASGLCVTQGTCTPGTANCVCNAGACNTGLTCLADLCEVITCPVGTAGCACAAGGTCTDAGLTCNTGNVCAPANCMDGASGCPCRTSGTACDGNQVCSATSTCVDPPCRGLRMPHGRLVRAQPVLQRGHLRRHGRGEHRLFHSVPFRRGGQRNVPVLLGRGAHAVCPR